MSASDLPASAAPSTRPRPGAPVVVVGSANVDLVVEVPYLPLPGQTVLGGDLSREAGGKGANQAVALARLGANVEFVGRVGADNVGVWLRAVLDAEGVGTTHLATTPDTTTGTAMIGVAPEPVSGGVHVENMILVAPGANMRLVPADLTVPEVSAALRRAPAVLAQLEVPVATVAAIVEHMAPKGESLLVLNPAPAPSPHDPLPSTLIERIDVIVPNLTELAVMTRHDVPTDDRAVTAALFALRDLGFTGAAVVTRGKHGSTVLTADDRIVRIRPLDIEVHDPTGAGDAFCAALTDRLVLGDDIEYAARFASVAGALTTAFPGAQKGMPTTEAVLPVVPFLHAPDATGDDGRGA
jgi:ribokinase